MELSPMQQSIAVGLGVHVGVCAARVLGASSFLEAWYQGPVQGQHSRGLLVVVWRGLLAYTTGRSWLGPPPAQVSSFEPRTFFWTPPGLQHGPAYPAPDFNPQLTSWPGLGPFPQRYPVPQAAISFCSHPPSLPCSLLGGSGMIPALTTRW